MVKFPDSVPPVSGRTGKLVVTAVRVSVMFPATIVVAAAATAIVASEIELFGVAGAEGEAAGVPATTLKTTLFVVPE